MTKATRALSGQTQAHITGADGSRSAIPAARWTPLALFWLFIGCMAVVCAAVTLMAAGMGGVLGCLAYGVIAILVARRARYWS